MHRGVSCLSSSGEDPLVDRTDNLPARVTRDLIFVKTHSSFSCGSSNTCNPITKFSRGRRIMRGFIFRCIVFTPQKLFRICLDGLTLHPAPCMVNALLRFCLANHQCLGVSLAAKQDAERRLLCVKSIVCVYQTTGG